MNLSECPLPAVTQDQQTVEQPERDRRDHEQIHRRDAVSMITKKGPPALGRWSPPSPPRSFRPRSTTSYNSYPLQPKALGMVCLSQTSSGWQMIANRAMLSPDVGPLQTDLVGARRPVPTESKAWRRSWCCASRSMSCGGPRQ